MKRLKGLSVTDKCDSGSPVSLVPGTYGCGKLSPDQVASNDRLSAILLVVAAICVALTWLFA